MPSFTGNINRLTDEQRVLHDGEIKPLVMLRRSEGHVAAQLPTQARTSPLPELANATLASARICYCEHHEVERKPDTGFYSMTTMARFFQAALTCTQVTLELVRDIAHTTVTLSPNTMANMTFKAGECMPFGKRSPPVRLVAEAPVGAVLQHAPPPAVEVTCHAKAGVQVLQPKRTSELWQRGLPIDESKLYTISVDFDGRFVMHG